MKTLKTLFRDLLTRNPTKNRGPSAKSIVPRRGNTFINPVPGSEATAVRGREATAVQESEATAVRKNLKKPITYETESNENHRVARLDNSSDTQDRGDAKQQSDQKSTQSGGSIEGKPAREPELRAETEAEACQASLKEERKSDAVQEAYRRGLIDGRNSRIEEIHFPKENDGIPVFLGSPSKAAASSDIFSMAREA